MLLIFEASVTKWVVNLICRQLLCLSGDSADKSPQALSHPRDDMSRPRSYMSHPRDYMSHPRGYMSHTRGYLSHVSPHRRHVSQVTHLMSPAEPTRPPHCEIVIDAATTYAIYGIYVIYNI